MANTTDDPLVEDHTDLEAIQPSEEENRCAAEFERRRREEAAVQFQRLKDQAHAAYGMLEGRPGVRSSADLQDLLEKAGDEIGNGRFILRQLGAERYIDVGHGAALITLRQNLIAEIERPIIADIMMVDTAVVAYYNFLRAQGWIGNLSLVFERELFGQEPLNEIHGPMLGDLLRDELERLSEAILPLQNRCHRMMIKSLERLSKRRKRLVS